MKYYYYNFIFAPINKDLGTKHTRTFKATSYENALKQARKEEAGCKQNGKQVYKLDLTTSITCRADLEKVEAGALIIIENNSNGYGLTDKDTGLSIGGAKTLKELDKLYNARLEAMYNKAIANAKIYKEAVNQLKQLHKERFIGGLLGQ